MPYQQHSPLNTLCVEDNSRDLKDLEIILRSNPGFNLLESFDNARQCLEYIQTHEVHLLFLDIELADENGLWLANEIKHLPVAVVFVTAFTRYAVKAFEACAIDYIIKPVTQPDIDNMLERLKTRIAKEGHLIMRDQIKEFSNYMLKDSLPGRIFVNTVGKVHVAELKDILYLTSKEGYTHIQLSSGERLVSSKHLKTYIDIVSDHPEMIQIHRSTVVNRKYIKLILKEGRKNKMSLQMTNGDVLPISSLKKNEIAQIVMK